MTAEPEPTAEEPRAPVIIAGIDDERGVHVARTLQRHGIETIGIAKSARSPGARTRSCKKIIQADTDTEEVIDVLANLGRTLPCPAVLIPCFDTTVSLISKHRERLAEFYLFSMPSDETVCLVKDKARFYAFAEKNNLSVPETVLLRDRADVAEAAARLRFPCILKPADSKSPRWQAETRLKAFLVDDKSALESFFDRYRGVANVLLAQNLVEGDDSSIYTCYGYYDADSTPLVEFTSRKLRQWPPHTGVGCLAEEVRQDEVRDTARRLVKDLGFRGLCSLEMKRDARDGRFYIIEANACRPTGRAAHPEACGVELVLTIYRDVLGLPPPESRMQSFEGRKWMHIRRDTGSSLKSWWAGELTLRSWLQSLRGDMSYALLSARDPGPFIAELTNTFCRALSAAFRR